MIKEALEWVAQINEPFVTRVAGRYLVAYNGTITVHDVKKITEVVHGSLDSFAQSVGDIGETVYCSLQELVVLSDAERHTLPITYHPWWRTTETSSDSVCSHAELISLIQESCVTWPSGFAEEVSTLKISSRNDTESVQSAVKSSLTVGSSRELRSLSRQVVAFEFSPFHPIGVMGSVTGELRWSLLDDGRIRVRFPRKHETIAEASGVLLDAVVKATGCNVVFGAVKVSEVS